MSYQHTFCQQEELPSEIINYIEQLDPDTDPALIQELIENLLYYQEEPLDLNRVSAQDLMQLQLIDDLKIQAIISYREKNGAFLRYEELQAIGALNLNDIRRLQPFLSVNSQPINMKGLWKSILSESSRTLFVRYERDFPLAKGYKGDEPAYEGNPDQIYTRLRWRYGTLFSTGFTMEKDHGESFFRGSNKQGFDFMSAHVYYRNPKSWLQIVALGDYKFNMGQGLIRHSGYGGGKSSFVMSFNKGGRVIQPYSSVDENLYLRGIASEIKLSDYFSLAAAVSYRNRDANQIQRIDTTDSAQESFITSLQSSGLHRTASEIEDENAIQHFSTGGRIKYQKSNFSLSANVWHDRLSDSLGTKPRPDNIYRFRGKNLTNASLDYQWGYKKFLLFGEVAHSFPGGLASITGLMTSVHPNIDIGILYRYLELDYQVLNPNAFVDNSATQNEQGLYLSTQIKINTRWSMVGYMDLWKHPWLRFQVDAPSQGSEYFAQLKYYHKRTFEAYLQYKRKTKDQNGGEVDNSNEVTPHTRESVRLHLSYKINKTWQWRSRIEWSQYYESGNLVSNGYMIYQDFNFKPREFPVSFTSRIALFQTDSYDSRIYAYENNVLYAYSIPAYYRNGLRSYINIRWRALRSLTLEGRYEISYYPREESLSSGNNEIQGNTFQGVKFQLRYNF